MEGWEQVTLGEVCDFQGGSQPAKSHFISENKQGYIRLLQIRDFTRDDKAVYIPEELSKRRCETSDIMIGRYGASVGQIHRGKSGSYNVALIKTIPDLSKINIDYFYLYLISPLFQKPLSNVSERSAQNGFSKPDIENFDFPLPPLAEQERIVAMLDEAFAAIDTATANTEKNLANAKELFESCLEDELARTCDIAPAHRLADLADRLTNGYVGPTRDIYQEEGVPYLLAKHVKNNRLKFDDKTYVTPEFNQKHKKSMLKSGDVLLVQSGHIGHSAVVTPQHDGHNCHAMIVISPKTQMLTGEYLSLFFNSPRMKDTFQHIRSGSTVPHLTCKAVREIITPVPHLEAQAAFTEKMRAQSSNTDRLQQQYDNMIGSLTNLKQSLLQKAFTGELTADPKVVDRTLSEASV